MRQQLTGLTGVLVVLALSSGLLFAQSAPRTAASSRVAKWTAPRTPDGKPDLQGIWDFRTVTPMERPSEFADKPTLTAEEAAAYERRIVEARNVDTNRDKTTSRGVINGTETTADVASAYNDFWWDRGTRVVSSLRTSLIVAPPDGRIPPLTPEALKRLEKIDAGRERPAEGPEDRSVGERCLLGFNAGPPITTGGYNQNLQIVQTPGYVVLLTEMVHTARIVPLDGRPHGSVPQWSGTSRGRWEGDTLVVDTKNFAHETSLRGSSPNLQLVERFTRTEEDVLLYEFTVTDPTTWTRPWTAQVPMRKTDDQMFEYACHEANYGMTNLLQGARSIEKTGRTGTQGSR